MKNKSFLIYWLICSAVFSLFFFTASYHDLGATTDSLAYEAAAKSWAQQHTLEDTEGQAYSQWAPLYPIILSFFAENLRGFIKWSHWLAMLMTLGVWLYFGRTFLKHNVFIILLGLSLSLNTSLLIDALFVWTETFFLFFLSLYLFFLHRYFIKPSFSSLLLATLFAFLMLIQRNAGVIILAGIALAMLLFHLKFLRRHFISLLIHTFVAISGIALWTYYNVFFIAVANVEGLTRRANYGNTIWLENVGHYFEVLGTCLLPQSLPSIGLSFISIVVVGILFYQAFHLRTSQSYFLRILLFVLLFYLLVLTVALKNYGFHETDRLLSVVYPIFFLGGFVSLEQYWIKLNEFWRKGMFIVCILWMLYPMMRIGKNAIHFYNNGKQHSVEIVEKEKAQF